MLVRNPMNRHLVSRVNLSPDVVDCIVFWSKNPYRMMDRLHKLRDYIFYFQYTLTGYGQILEPNVPACREAVAVFHALSEIIGKDRIIWRYDPIILSEQFNIMYHADRFEEIARQLSGKTRQCIISFVDMYKKSKRNMASFPVIEIQVEQVIEVAAILSKISSEYGIELTSCAETVDLEQYGINHGKCIDINIIEEISDSALDLDKDPTQRSECGCVASVDIGTYNTCAHKCLYCYANYSHNQVQHNYAAHDPHSPLLFGEIGPGDKVYERKMVNCKKLQSPLF